MQFDWWTFLLQIINVVVLIWLLNHFLFRPIVAIINRRKADTARVLDEAGAAKQAANKAEAVAKAQAEQVATERMAVLEAARKEAEVEKKSLLEQAQKEIAKIRAEATISAKLLQAREQARQELKSRDLAVAITEKLLTNLPEDARITGYPARLAKAIRDLDDEQKAAIFADKTPLEIVSARALSKSEMSEVKAAITNSAPHPRKFALSFTVEPDLIAGLELRSQHGIIRNSLKSDLARIRKALEANDQG